MEQLSDGLSYAGAICRQAPSLPLEPPHRWVRAVLTKIRIPVRRRHPLAGAHTLQHQIGAPVLIDPGTVIEKDNQQTGQGEEKDSPGPEAASCVGQVL